MEEARGGRGSPGQESTRLEEKCGGRGLGAGSAQNLLPPNHRLSGGIEGVMFAALCSHAGEIVLFGALFLAIDFPPLEAPSPVSIPLGCRRRETANPPLPVLCKQQTKLLWSQVLAQLICIFLLLSGHTGTQPQPLVGLGPWLVCFGATPGSIPGLLLTLHSETNHS